MTSKIEKMKQRGWLRQFMSETPFHGFGIAFQSRSSVEFVGWLMVVSLCAVLAVYQTVCLINVYQSEPTMTNTTITHDGFLDLRDLHVCFTWDFDPDLTESNLHLTESVDSVLATVNEAQLDQFATGNYTATTLDAGVTRLILAMLMDVIRHEAYYWHPDRHWGSQNGNSSFYETINAAYYKVYHFFAVRHVSMGQLARFIGSVACQEMKVTISGVIQEESAEICNPQRITLLNAGGFCMTPDSTSPNLVIDSVEAILQFTVDPTHFRYFLNETKSNNEDIGAMTVDLFGGRFLDKNHKYVIRTPYGQESETTIDIQGHYEGYNSRRRPCYRPKNATNCRSYCDAEVVVKLCGCWQLWWSMSLPNEQIRICTDEITSVQSDTQTPYYIPDYHTCLSNETLTETAFSDSEDCMKGCLDDCSHTKILFSTEKLCKNCSTSLTIRFRSFWYPIVEEVLVKSWKTFIAEFGGLLGLWLGGSFIAFSHVLLMLLRAIHYVTVEKCQLRGI